VQQPPHFSTPRLRLRPFQSQDLSLLQRYAVREDFWRFLPLEPQTPESVKSFLDQRLTETWGEGGFHCAVELIGPDHLIGTARVSVRDAANLSGDIGYGLDSDYYGHGYMTEAVRRIVEIGIRELALHRVWATADVENTASWRLMERIGMRREGLLCQHKHVRGEWRDSYLYARLAGDRDE
jgi:RimJ/RimL family protein N-acetyltransferase